jgi:acyl-CoA synthetase (AMP-forming)/AMP-acid ligase II
MGQTMQRVNLRDFGADANKADNSAAIQLAINTLLVNTTDQNVQNRGGTIVVSDLYRITETVGISVSNDFICKLRIESDHGSRRGPGFHMTDPTKPCFQLKTNNLGIIRDFDMSGIQLKGGSFGLDLEFDAYNTFDRVTFEGNVEAGIRSHNGGEVTSHFSRCWWTNVPGDAAHGLTGGLWFSDCLFGEGCGGFRMTGTQLQLFNCKVWNSQTWDEGEFGEGSCVFKLRNGSGLHMVGGKISASTPTKSIFFTDFARDLHVSGVDIVANATVENLIADLHAHSGTKPFPIIYIGGGTKLSTRRPEGISIYEELGDIGDDAQVHQDAVIDIVSEYKTTPPFACAAFLHPDRRNTMVLRARLDQD